MFQSCVRASAGAKAPCWRWVAGKAPGVAGPLAAAWMGILRTRWLDAEAGVRRSKSRRWESEETAERTDGECGEKAVE